jgi:hypothetical protein
MSEEKILGATPRRSGAAGSIDRDVAPHAAPTHTPGPWRLVKSRFGDHTIRAGRDDIGYLYPTDGADDPVRYPVDANGNLIAAAPEMYEALKAMLEQKGFYGGVFDRARAAIAKAEGK